ncbi:toxin-antitoxin system YwqK family antitoxin [Spirosoma flavum]|uniref:Toxin-antitoxin system YwqK family antitoxin n=1 Tax=Spirosoma flavum TaxID=2048557 RepID=A0ABW6ARC6_9BACT
MTTAQAQAIPSAPASLTTAAKPVLAPSGAPASPLSGFSSLPSSLTTLGLPTMSSLKEQKDAYLAGIMPDLGLKVKQLKKLKADRKNKHKLSKTEYEGLSMIKAYTKLGSGERTIVEEFYVMRDKDAVKPLPYIREVYRYYQKSARVTSSIVRDEGAGLLLHGPYKRYQNGDLVEEGYYYAGMKDGRWEKYDSKFMLIDKVRWYRGVPAESQLVYYDSTHHKIKEIIPIEYSKVKGPYMAFYENGLLAEEGKYENGVKIGRWTEYYPVNPNGRRMRRKLTQCARDQWDTTFEPYTISEWDEKGKLTYERAKEKVIEEEESEN